MKKIILLCFLIVLFVGGWFLYSEIYSAVAQEKDSVLFEVQKGESVSALALRLEEEQIIRQSWLFKYLIQAKGVDKQVQAGEFEVTSPITLMRVIKSLSRPGIQEREITILPGWSLREIGDYLEEEGLATKEELFSLLGKPAFAYYLIGETAPLFSSITDVEKIIDGKPRAISYEGYLAPNTYRIYQEDPLENIIERLLDQREAELTNEMRTEIKKQGRSVHEVLTMASIVEREVQSKEDKAIVADIFWRRLEQNWALQADSTVHYVVGKSGDVFTTKEDRSSTSPWNTYAYPGLPPGPISNPSLETIKATISPKANDNWYFLTDLEGNVHYGKTLEDHNQNVQRYLR